MKKLLGLVLLALAIFGTVKVVGNTSKQSAPMRSGNSAYDAGRKAGQYCAPLFFVAIGIFGLRLLLQSDDSRPAPPPRRTPAAGDPSLRVGGNTFASNPALLRLNSGQWLAANPWVIVVSSCFAAAGVVVFFIKLPVGIVLLLTAGVVLFRELRFARRKFFQGDVCPGVVLSTQQNLVAVYTDLKAASIAPRPAIKILKQPLRRITTEAAYDGMRVAAAALYFGNVRQAAWWNFMPEVIQCVIQDPAEIERVTGSITEEEWQALDAGLAQIAVAKPGLYRVSSANSAAATAPDGAPRNEPDFVPAQPWFKSKFAIIGLSVLGGILGLIIVVNVVALMSRRVHPRSAMPPSGLAMPPPAANFASPQQPTQSGPFAVGGQVEANWAGGWILGTITSINPGGFTLMVQLQDARFPGPILLSTNQLRRK